MRPIWGVDDKKFEISFSGGFICNIASQGLRPRLKAPRVPRLAVPRPGVTRAGVLRLGVPRLSVPGFKTILSLYIIIL